MRIKRTVVFLILVAAAGAAWAGPAQSAQAQVTKLKVTADEANLREKPDIGSSIVQTIPEGTILEADRKEGEWYFVRYTLEDGGVIGGWIHESLVTVLGPGAPAGAPPGQPARRVPPPETKPRPAEPRRPGRIRPPEFRSGSVPLEFSVSAGLATLAPSDLNEGSQGYVQWFAAAAGLTGPQEVDFLHLAGLVGFELSYRFSPSLAFGLGADFLQGSNRDRIELADSVTETVSTKPSVRAVPVKLMVRYYPGYGFYVRGALGVYSVKTGYHFRREDAEGWEEWKGSASTSGFGGEAAFGGEWDLAPRTTLFVEAGLRMVSFSGLTGKGTYQSSGVISVGPTVNPPLSETGTLYFFHKTAGGGTDYPLIAVRAAVPAEEGVVDARRARINISGTAVRVGVRYKF
jgi:hypothetical protein